MANNAVELLLKLKAQATGFKGANDALGKLNDQVKKGVAGVKKLGDEVKKDGYIFTKMGKAGAKEFKNFSIAATATAAAVGAVVAKVNSMNLELRRNSTLAGTSIENFQKFAIIGEQAGVSAEHTADSLNNLNLKITEWSALAGGAGGDVLKKLGLDATELSKVQDSGQQMITFLDKLGKSSKNVQRLFADELGSDALIFLANAAKEAGNLEEAMARIEGSGNIISQEESDRLNNFNKQMVNLQASIKKVGAEAVLAFEDELTGALNSAQSAMTKLIKDFQDPFGETNKSLTMLSGTLDSFLGGLKILKDGLDLLGSEEGSLKFDMNAKELNDDIEQVKSGFKDLFFTDFALAEKEVNRLSKTIEEFNPSRLLAEGMAPEEVDKQWKAIANVSLENVKQMQDAVLRYPPKVQRSMTVLLDRLVEDVKQTNAEVAETIASGDFKANLDVELNPQDIINKADIAVRVAQSQIDFIEIQFKAGTIDLTEYKNQVNEQIKIQNEALKKASDNAVGLDQLGYRKRLEQNKIFAKKIADTQSLAATSQVKANDEIAKQEIEILKNKGKEIEVLKEQERLEIEQLKRRKDLSDIDKAVQSINIGELFDFKRAEVEADNISQKIEKILEKAGQTTGAEQLALFGDLDGELKKLQLLKTTFGGLNVDIERYTKERDDIAKESVLSEEEIKEASDLVLQSKIEVLNAQGKTNEAKALQLKMTIADLNANKNLTAEQRTQLAQDAIALSNLERQAEQTAKIKAFNDSINQNLLTMYKAQGDLNKVKDLELKLEIERINANKAYTAEQKTKLAQDAIALSNLERQKQIEENIAYNKAELQKREIDLLNIQGKKSEVLEIQHAQEIESINNNKKLTDEVRNQIIEIENQKLAYGQARLEVEKIEENIQRILEQMSTASSVEEFNKLALSMQPSLDKLREMEAEFPSLSTKSQEFTDSAQKNLDRLSLSVEEASNIYAENFVDVFSSIIDGSETAESAFKKMLFSMAQELLKSNISSLLNNIFGSGGGGGADYSGIFTGIASVFGGTALHTGGIAGRDGFARNVPMFDLSSLTKYHTGGIAGLKPNEVPTILEKGEEVLTASDPRHRDNGGQASNNITIINETNSENQAKELGTTRAFGDAIRNEIRSNPSEYKSYLA